MASGAPNTAEEENLWNSILSEASQRSASDRLESKTVLVLGDKYCGKSFLAARLEGIDISEVSSGVALDYSFLDIKSADSNAFGGALEDEDPVSRLNLWQLEGEVEHKDLIKFAVNPQTLGNTVVVITIDLSLPWKLVESLEKWLKVLEEHLEGIYKTSKNKILKEELQKALIYYYQQYTETASHPAGSKVPKKKRPTTIEDSMLLPLGQGVLSNNLGVPIIVVGTKVDSLPQLEKEYNYKEAHFDYITQYIRRICLRYGAALIYTSAKKDVNCDVLLDYIRYTLYNFEMNHPAQMLEKDHLFIPAGADSMNKIQVDFDNQPLTKDPDEPFSEVIKIPKKFVSASAVTVDPVIIAEDDQDFLNKYRDIIEKEKETAKDNKEVSSKSVDLVSADAKEPSTPPTVARTAAGQAAGGTPLSTQSQTLPAPSARPPPPQSSQASSSASPQKSGNMDDHKVLASFFDSLIHKERPAAGPAASGVPRKAATAELAKGLSIPPHKGGPTSPPAGSASPTSREDASKELERLKKRAQQSPTNP